MSVTVTKNDIAKTAVLSGDASSETIDVAALVPQANDPIWQVEIRPGGGNDTILGSGGMDTIYASPGDDVADGGSTWDWLTFDMTSLGLTGTLSLDPGGPFQSLRLTSGGITTTLFTITINANGSYTIDGATPETQAAFGRESTTNIERVEFNLGNGNGSLTVVNGTPGNDWLPGTLGDDVAYGFDGDDVMWGGEGGINYLYGGVGRDLLVGGVGIDHMDGGTGVDTASYQTSSGPVVASLANPAINTGDAAGDTYANIQQLTGTLFGSTLYGDNTGRENELFAIGGTNYLYGGTGYATLVSGPGDDHMFGGAGGGFADYETSKSGVTASLIDSSINAGEALGDTYSNVHDLGGSVFNDILHGDNFANNFVGNAGDDRIFGYGGNDTLTGGTGANVLTGGAGSDWFVFGGPGVAVGGAPLATLAVLADARNGIYSEITDFDRGNSGAYDVLEGDSIHISALVSGLFAGGNAPIRDLAQIIQDASGSFAWFQVHAADGSWLNLTRVDGLHVADYVGVVVDESAGVANIQVRGKAPPIDIGLHGNAAWPISGVGDFNGDGDSDILWRNPSTGQVDQWQMKNGGWAQSVDLGGGKPANWTLAGTGDFDGDGTSDIVWRNIANSQVDQWHMRNGNWASSIDLGTSKGADWTLAGIGDFNGDGVSDILWRKIGTGLVDQWEMRNGNWSQSIDLGSGKGAEWTLAGVGDFNGDGVSDILWRSVNTSQVDQWEMRNGNWSKSIDLGASKGADWVVAGTGDYNHDGTSDILWFNKVTGSEEYWAMRNGNWSASVNLGTLSTSWSPAGIGDFNHDGGSDALWLDQATAHVHEQLWMM